MFLEGGGAYQEVGHVGNTVTLHKTGTRGNTVTEVTAEESYECVFIVQRVQVRQNFIYCGTRSCLFVPWRFQVPRTACNISCQHFTNTVPVERAIVQITGQQLEPIVLDECGIIKTYRLSVVEFVRGIHDTRSRYRYIMFCN